MDRVATVIAARMGVVVAGVLGTNHPPVTPGQTAIIDKMRQTVAHFVALCRRYSIVKIVVKVRVAQAAPRERVPVKGETSCGWPLDASVFQVSFGRQACLPVPGLVMSNHSVFSTEDISGHRRSMSGIVEYCSRGAPAWLYAMAVKAEWEAG